MTKINPLASNFEECLEKIKYSLKNKDTILIIDNSNDVACIFSELLIQTMKRNINNEEISFVAIRNVVLKPKYKSGGLFRNFICELEKLDTPILINDIVNENLKKFFIKKHYKEFIDYKNNEKIESAYKIF